MKDSYRATLVLVLLSGAAFTQAFKLSSKGSHSKGGKVDANKGASPPRGKLFFKDTIPSEVTRVHAGQTLELLCEAGGSPTPTVHWLFDDARIPQGWRNKLSDDEASYEESASNSRRPTLRLGATKGRLTIDCVTAEDAGLYTCVAETPTARITTNTLVEIDDSDSDVYSEECVARGADQGSPPNIYMWTVHRLEFQGADVQLYCRADGYPAPKVTWVDRNGHGVIDGSAGYRILSNGDLLIKGVSWMKHMGMFRCVASNGNGQDTASTFLYPTAP